ncbi:hypothetical protein [Basilea psittacipulmonis]|uniref:DUF4435 domain-containing protein n=2 Tax=Basilea TaxID=1472344 RepID=A0A077DCR3_9BURK|nr:hypothetical protein [Basilea psittacipulmonis]AIL32394.1 hypothetical protein IX83_02870 [Basilea psittacipulmonis DSM 24701]
MSRHRKQLFIVEGETEEVFLSEILEVPGKIVILNLWQENLKKHIAKYNKSNTFVVFDVDSLDPRKIETMCKNLQLLKEMKLLAGLMQQTENFEEELIRCCRHIKSAQKLCDVFGAVSLSEFKNKFISTGGKSIKKLNDHGFNRELLWTGQLIPELKEYKTYQVTHNHLKRKKIIS